MAKNQQKWFLQLSGNKKQTFFFLSLEYLLQSEIKITEFYNVSLLKMASTLRVPLMNVVS